MRPVVKISGNWQGTLDFFKDIATTKEVKRAAFLGQRKFADKLLKIVLDHIDNQDLGWADKKKPNNDPRVLVDMEDYYNHIRIYQEDYTVHVGVRRGDTNRLGKSLWKIALTLEMGRDGRAAMEARPLWEPSLLEMGGRRALTAMVRDSIKKRLEKMKSRRKAEVSIR